MSEIERNTSAMPANKFREIESIVSPYISRPQAEQLSFDDSKCYNFVVLDIETSTVNVNTAEVCQLSAIDYSGSHTFTEYVLPEGDIDVRATDIHNLKIRNNDGVRQLCKNNVVVPTLHINEAIKNFEIYISQSVERAKATTNKDVVTVLIGHNLATVDARVILRNAGKEFADTLQSMDVLFADSLKLFRALVKDKLPALQNADGTFPKIGQASLYYALFQEGQEYRAHDALEDATALRKILFLSRLELSFNTIVDNSRLVSVDHAFRDMQYLDHRSRNSKSFMRIAYDPRTDRGLKKGMIDKMSGSGLTYGDLKKVYKRYGADGVVAILSKSPTASPSSKPRVTRTERILTTVVEHFQCQSSQNRQRPRLRVRQESLRTQRILATLVEHFPWLSSQNRH